MTTKLYQVHVQIIKKNQPVVNFVDFQTVEFKQALRIAHQFQNSLSVIRAIKITTKVVEIPSHENTKPIPKGENTSEKAYRVKAIYTSHGCKQTWNANITDTLPQAIKRAGRIGASLRKRGFTFVKTQCVEFVGA